MQMRPSPAEEHTTRLYVLGTGFVPEHMTRVVGSPLISLLLAAARCSAAPCR
jgi:hypothetical protein